MVYTDLKPTLDSKRTNECERSLSLHHCCNAWAGLASLGARVH